VKTETCLLEMGICGQHLVGAQFPHEGEAPAMDAADRGKRRRPNPSCSFMWSIYYRCGAP
jgi:hypothetical protein